MASGSTTRQSPHAEPTTSGYSKTTRRQYQSCDPCRKSRRACDAGALRVINFPLAEQESSTTSVSTCEACSNCAKSGKKCTFDWLRTLPVQGLPKGVKRKLALTGFPESKTGNVSPETNPRHSLSPRSSLVRESTLSSVGSGSLSNSDSQGTVDSKHSAQLDSALSTCSKLSADRVACVSAGTTHHTATEHQWPVPNLTRYGTNCSSSSSMSIHSSTSTISASTGRRASSICSDSSRERESADTQSPTQAKHKHRIHSIEAAGRKPTIPTTSTPSRRPSISSTLPSTGRHASSTPLSPHQVRFADVAMKSMIATGLLRIYHDSFENSLSCWVTEQNCPYETELRDLIAKAKPGSASDEAALRLDDNRIFSRVSRLDSAFAPLRGRDLTTIESRTATKALNAAIMAFASQWSHSSHNNKKKESRSRATDPILSSECERAIQEKLWHEARAAIQDTAEIDSFKVILAYMLFALTQRPIDQSQRLSQARSAAVNDQRGWSGGTSVHVHSSMAGLEVWDPFAADDLHMVSSPPIYLETAVRNLFSWRRKLERYRCVRRLRRSRSNIKSSSNSNSNINSSSNSNSKSLSQTGTGTDGGGGGALALKDQQTFNILFWLGVMCDTTSSAITKRPLVIPDEDCAMILDEMDAADDGRSDQAFVSSDGLGGGGSGSGSGSGIGTGIGTGTGTGVGIDIDIGSGISIPPPKPIPNPDPNPDPATAIPIPDMPNPNATFNLNLNPNLTPNLWGRYLLSFTTPKGPPTRYPCPFTHAAQTLQSAIPVKVLLFRKVAQLQTLPYHHHHHHHGRHSHNSTLAAEIEHLINESLTVYQHWNQTYAPFISDCIRHHHNLPPRLQSWYVILAGHWHCGCLLLADAINVLDREGLGLTLTARRELRIKCGLTAGLKRDNALAVAEIAAVSLDEGVGGEKANVMGKVKLGFSFACGGSAMLTEPWTDVLVRALASACAVFIDDLSVASGESGVGVGVGVGSSGGGGGGGGKSDGYVGGRDGDADINIDSSADHLIAKAKTCIQGMALLGRKSDTAALTAEMFGERLDKVCAGRRRYQNQHQHHPQQHPHPQHQHQHQYQHQNQHRPSTDCGLEQGNKTTSMGVNGLDLSPETDLDLDLDLDLQMNMGSGLNMDMDMDINMKYSSRSDPIRC